jgi:hypothetical protein
MARRNEDGDVGVVTKEISRDLLWDVAMARLARGGNQIGLKHALAWAAEQLLEIGADGDGPFEVRREERSVPSHIPGFSSTRITIVALDTIEETPVVVRIERTGKGP